MKFLAVQSQGAESIIPAFPNAAALPSNFAMGTRCGPSPAQRAAPRAEETFFALRQAPGGSLSNALQQPSAFRGVGKREREGRHRKENGAGGQSRCPFPTLGRQLIPAGDMHMDAGHMDAGRIRTAAPQVPEAAARASPRGTRGTRGRCRLAGAAAGEEGRSPSSWGSGAATPFRACAGCRGMSRSLRRCHPAPDRPHTSSVTTLRPSVSSIAAATPTQSSQRMQQGKQCLCPC